MSVVHRLLIALLILALFPAASTFADSAPCQFVLGFKALHDLIPAQVGGCVDNEQHNPQNGDGLQHTTTGGLLVWRKADNWTAFTDGYRTWVNGPNGLQQRLNTQRFAWEANPEHLPAPDGSTSGAVAPGDSVSLDQQGKPMSLGGKPGVVAPVDLRPPAPSGSPPMPAPPNVH